MTTAIQFRHPAPDDQHLRPPAHPKPAPSPSKQQQQHQHQQQQLQHSSPPKTNPPLSPVNRAVVGAAGGAVRGAREDSEGQEGFSGFVREMEESLEQMDDEAEVDHVAMEIDRMEISKESHAHAQLHHAQASAGPFMPYIS